MSLAEAIENIKAVLPSVDSTLKGRAAIDAAKREDPRLANIEGTLRGQVISIADVLGIDLGEGWTNTMEPEAPEGFLLRQDASLPGADFALAMLQGVEARDNGRTAVRARDWVRAVECYSEAITIDGFY
jgi:hypothetical protein